MLFVLAICSSFARMNKAQIYKKSKTFYIFVAEFNKEARVKIADTKLEDWLRAVLEGEEIPDEVYLLLISKLNPEQSDYLRNYARHVAQKRFGKNVFVRGLIEISNYCRNNCYYCGIRCSAQGVERYRLSEAQIMDCCLQGHRLGFSTFVLQGGEDMLQNDDRIEHLVRRIRTEFPQTAITLSVGERSEEAYRRFRKAGADRYLLRHETYNASHYATLHPSEMHRENRLHCLEVLKKLGYQTGTGMMIGSPGQTTAHLLQDIRFMEQLQPEMIGIGPFVPAASTPFATEKSGSVELTLNLVALLRLRFPDALIPATTALGTLDARGREKAICSGANVLMPNLSPREVRTKYNIYDHKLCSGDEAAEGVALLKKRLHEIGYSIVWGRGDYFQNRNHV